MSAVRSLNGRDVVWEPHPRQAVALSCPAQEIMYGGAKGGGKSDYLVMAPVHLLALAHKKWKETGVKQGRCRIVFFRKNLDNLKDLLERMKFLYPLIDPEGGGLSRMYNKLDKRFTFSSGAYVDVTHLDGPDDHGGFQGQELRMVLIDQAEQIRGEVIDFLRAQIRTSDPDFEHLIGLRLSANPGAGDGIDYIRARYIKSGKPNVIQREVITLEDGREKIRTRVFVPAKLWDNPSLAASGDYEASIKTLPEHMQRMYLDGDWDVVVGAYFSHIWDKTLHCCRSFPIPPGAEIAMGIDWGKTSPSCVLFGTINHETDTIYIIDEIYQPGITGSLFAEVMQRKFDEQTWSPHREWGKEEVAGHFDWHAWHSDGEGMSPGEAIAAAGFRLVDALKDRAGGIHQVTERLVKRADGKPRVVIFEDRCPNLVRTLPNLRGDKHKPDDIDTRQEDHAFDALRYLLNGWPFGVALSERSEDKELARWLQVAREAKRLKQEKDDETFIHAGY